MHIGEDFYGVCVAFHAHTLSVNCIDARVAAYKALIERHGFNQVMRHGRAIARALNAIEACADGAAVQGARGVGVGGVGRD